MFPPSNAPLFLRKPSCFCSFFLPRVVQSFQWKSLFLFFHLTSLRITFQSVCFAGVCGRKDAFLFIPDASLSPVLSFLLQHPPQKKTLFPLHLPLCSCHVSFFFFFFFPQVKFFLQSPFCLCSATFPLPPSFSLLSQRSRPVIGRVYE